MIVLCNEILSILFAKTVTLFGIIFIFHKNHEQSLKRILACSWASLLSFSYQLNHLPPSGKALLPLSQHPTTLFSFMLWKPEHLTRSTRNLAVLFSLFPVNYDCALRRRSFKNFDISISLLVLSCFELAPSFKITCALPSYRF